MDQQLTNEFQTANVHRVILARFRPKKIALISRDWRRQTTQGPGKFLDQNMGFEPHFVHIARLASKQGADTLLFSLWSHDARKLGELSRRVLFPRGTRHQVVILGVKRAAHEEVEIHFRSLRAQIKLRQLFSKTSNGKKPKSAFLADLPARQLGSVLIFICGEINIIKTRRRTKRIADPYFVLPRLRASRAKLILNPVHTYMRRYEMPLKRRALAKATNILVSVWNRGRKNGAESACPWVAYRRGRPITEQIAEVNALASQPGVRIGILKLR